VLDPCHAAVVSRGVVIVTQEMQQPVQREYFQFCRVGMPRFAGLPARHARGNGDVAEVREAERGVRRKTQDVGDAILATVGSIQKADLRI